MPAYEQQYMSLNKFIQNINSNNEIIVAKVKHTK